MILVGGAAVVHIILLAGYIPLIFGSEAIMVFALEIANRIKARLYNKSNLLDQRRLEWSRTTLEKRALITTAASLVAFNCCYDPMTSP